MRSLEFGIVGVAAGELIAEGTLAIEMGALASGACRCYATIGDKGFRCALAKLFLKQCAIYSYCGKCASRNGKGDVLHWVDHIAASVDTGNACLPEVIYLDRSKIGKFAA
jgi:hypothetical protein